MKIEVVHVNSTFNRSFLTPYLLQTMKISRCQKFILFIYEPELTTSKQQVTEIPKIRSCWHVNWGFWATDGAFKCVLTLYFPKICSVFISNIRDFRLIYPGQAYNKAKWVSFVHYDVNFMEQRFKEKGREMSATFWFWLSFLEAGDILLKLLRADHAADFEMRLDQVCQVRNQRQQRCIQLQTISQV